MSSTPIWVFDSVADVVVSDAVAASGLLIADVAGIAWIEASAPNTSPSTNFQAQATALLRDELAAQGVETRAAVHLGEVDRRGPDIASLSVHVAARILAHADAGQILCSGALPVVLTGSGVAFTPLGRHALKGLDGERELWGLDA
jgi:class 3 adenylate cyclase